MRLSEPIFCLGLVCILAAACQQLATEAPVASESTASRLARSASPQGASTTPACDELNINSGKDFVTDKVLLLSASYDPTTGAAPLAQQIIGPVSSGYRHDLERAFTIAPPFFQNQLCSLTYVFVVQCAQNPCTAQDALTHSWGLREWKGAKSGEYIGISAALWQNTNAALGFNLYRNMRLTLLLSTVSGVSNLSAWSSPPTFSANPNKNGEMSVLASLAHEVGHVLWYDEFVPTRGGNFVPANFCSGFYPTGAWGNVDIPPNRWIAFGQPNSNIKHNPDYIGTIASDLTIPNNFLQAGDDLNTLFSDPSLTGTFAAVSPDEDFVETYMLYVLLSARDSGVKQLQHLLISITGHSGQTNHDIADLSSKQVLANKMGCFAGSITNLRNMIAQ